MDALEKALANGADPLTLRNDPDALAPESLLVFELKDQALPSFINAIEQIDGLDLVGEEDMVDDDQKTFLYLMIPTLAAISKLLSLWNLWKTGKALPDDADKWELVFQCLHDLRRWGPKDRVSQEDADFIADQAASSPNAEVRIEVELIFERNDRKAGGLRERTEAALEARGGRIVRRARINEIAYHALLVDISAAEAKALVDRDQHTLAGIPDLFAIRPQSMIDIDEGSETTPPGPIAVVEPTEPAIAAILDGVPVQNHPAFNAHVDMVDPDDLAAKSVGVREHGTAMVSLVVHGDLNRNEAPLTRKLIVRPIMFAYRPDDPKEVFDRDRLLVDDFVRAVRDLKGQPGGASPDVFVINVSLGDRHRPFFGRASAWARAIDWLAHEYGILFFVSAGNAEDDLELDTVRDDTEFAAKSGADRAKVTLCGTRKALPRRRLLSPAEAVNAITVGALHDDALNKEPTVGRSFDPLPVVGLPTPASRFGPGVANAIKPDLLMPGGRLRVGVSANSPPKARIAQPNSLGGLKVAGARLNALGQLESNAWSGATSGAAALGTRAAHLVHDALRTAYPDDYRALAPRFKALLVKALLQHRCEIDREARTLVEDVFGPPDKGKHLKRADNVFRVFGNGVPRLDEVMACLESRATLWGTGSLGADSALQFKLPLPACLSGHRGLRRLSVTLAWFTSVTPGRRAYRSERLIVEEPTQEHTRQVLTGVEDHQVGSKRASRGTVFNRSWQGKGIRTFVAGADFLLRVARKPDSLDDLPDLTHFAFVATLEASDNELPIYNEIKARIAIQPQVPVTIRVPIR